MKLAIIILAAGNSRRFGQNKLLASWQGRPMYEYTLERYQNFNGQRILVTQYSEIVWENYQRIYNAHSERGISYSLQLGLEAAPDAEYYLFSVCDQPRMRYETIEAMLNGFWSSGKGIGCCAYKGEMGNPVIFAASYRQELMELTGDTGGKRVARRHMEDLWLYEVEDPEELIDIDTPAENK